MRTMRRFSSCATPRGDVGSGVLPDLEAPTFTRVMLRVIAKDALFVNDSRAAYAQFAEDTGLLHIALNASKGERTYGSYQHPERQRLHQPPKGLAKPL